MTKLSPKMKGLIREYSERELRIKELDKTIASLKKQLKENKKLRKKK